MLPFLGAGPEMEIESVVVCGHKSNKNFSRSAVSFDEAYQQNNAIINGDGGAID